MHVICYSQSGLGCRRLRCAVLLDIYIWLASQAGCRDRGSVQADERRRDIAGHHDGAQQHWESSVNAAVLLLFHWAFTDDRRRVLDRQLVGTAVADENNKLVFRGWP